MVDIFQQKVAYDREVMETVWDFSLEPSEIADEVAEKIFYYLYDKKRNIPSTGTYLEEQLKANLKDISKFSQGNLEMSKKLLRESFQKFEKSSKEHYRTYKELSFRYKRQQLEEIVKSQNPELKESFSLWKHIERLPIWSKSREILHSARDVLNKFTHQKDYFPNIEDEKTVHKALKKASKEFGVPLQNSPDFKIDLEIPKLEKYISEKSQKLEKEKRELASLKKEREELNREVEKPQIVVKNRRNRKKVTKKTESVDPKKKELLDSAISLLEKNIVDTSSELESVKLELQRVVKLRTDFLPLQKKFVEDQKYFDDYYKQLKEVSEIFGDLSSLTGMGWDLSKGVLHSKEWLNLQKFSKILEQREKLKELAKTLGRMKYSSDDFDMENILYKEIVVEKKRKLSSNSKDEVKGIYQSSDIHRVMPSELIYLANPETENIFYSKMFENKLLSYELQGYEDEVHQREIEKEKREKKAKKERGPIIVNIDTSGSMNGVPEEVAKALTLAMVKTALKEDRECYLITFSSANQTIEYELTKGDGALNNLMDFLLKSFGGGTDFETPLNRSLEILKRDNFSKSDILFVSDGYAGITSEMSEKLKSAKKESNFKITTVIVGSEVNEDKFSDKIVNFKNI
jgi:uncharacterized protein with von Willebrand factor type A (vWA) domain